MAWIHLPIVIYLQLNFINILYLNLFLEPVDFILHSCWKHLIRITLERLGDHDGEILRNTIKLSCIF